MLVNPDTPADKYINNGGKYINLNNMYITIYCICLQTYKYRLPRDNLQSVLL